MKAFNNKGELTGEISTGLTENGDRITTNTLYDRGNPVVQTITVRDNQGNVRTTTVLGTKILP